MKPVDLLLKVPAHFARSLYHKTVPLSIRRAPLVVKVKLWAYKRFLPHDVLYDGGYFEGVDLYARRSASSIAASILKDFSPKSVVDVGCGTGALLFELKQKGCSTYGLEYADAAIRFCRSRGLTVTKLDLENDDFVPEKKFDVAISTEVAEHLPESVADRYLRLLSSLSDQVVFTAAPPGQGGEDHVNEQPPEYWIAKFNALGFQHDRELSGRWQQNWKENGQVAQWYWDNLMIFRKKQTPD